MFRIRHAAKLAGINPTLLRAWERRYHLVTPQRTSSGYRVYSDNDIEVLRAAARLCSAGHTISEVARLSPAQLLASAAQLDPRPATDGSPQPGARDPAAAIADGQVRDGVVEAAALAQAVAAALHAINRFDRRAFEAALFPLSTMAALSPTALCEQVLLPLLRAIGDEWEQGRMTIAAEHFGSALSRAKIMQCLEFVARGATGPRLICACPENELHEGGLLAFAVRAAVDHWQVIYLGAHTPLDQALDTAVRLAADRVALSLTIGHGDAAFAQMLQLVAKAQQTRPGLRVLMGGREAVARRPQLEAVGMLVADDIETALTLLARLPPDKTHTS